MECENCGALNGNNVDRNKYYYDVLCTPCQEALVKNTFDNEVITGWWEGEPIVRPMTIVERYFKKLHDRDEDHDHKETCPCNV